jgi:MFS transporter, OPA family, sugar phosphate sensor protein UhpC
MASDLSRPQRIWRYRIFAITWLAYAGFYLCRRNFSVVMPLLQKDLGYSNFQLANLIFCYSLFYSAGQFCFGPLADRFGSRLTVGLGLLLSIGATVLMGFTPVLAALTVLCCANGLGQSAGWPGLVKNMAPWFRQRERGVVMGWWTTNYVIGGSLAVVFATFVATRAWAGAGPSWQRGFWLPAALLFAITLLYAAIARNRPSDAGLPEIDDGSATQSNGSRLSAPDERSAGGRWLFFRMLGDLEVWTIALGCAFSKMIRYSFLYWLPLYMTQKLRYSASEAGYTSSLYEFVGFTGAILAGYVSDKFMQARRIPVAAVMFWGLALVCWLHPTFAAMGRGGVAVSIALIGIMNFGPDTLLQGAASQDAGAKWGVGTASGFISGFGSVGQLFSPFLVAYVAGKYGWDRLFYGFVVIALFAGALLATQWNREARQTRSRAMAASAPGELEKAS